MALPTAAECEELARQVLASHADAHEAVHQFNYDKQTATGGDADTAQIELRLAQGFAAVAAELRS